MKNIFNFILILAFPAYVVLTFAGCLENMLLGWYIFLFFISLSVSVFGISKEIEI